MEEAGAGDRRLAAVRGAADTSVAAAYARTGSRAPWASCRAPRREWKSMVAVGSSEENKLWMKAASASGYECR